MPKLGVTDWFAAGQAIVNGDLNRYGPGAKHADRFERRFAQMLGVRHALAVNSGTSALVAALSAAGIGPGDEVLVPAYTWMATAAAPVLVGAVPVLVDIDETLTIDPQDIERKLTPHTRAIIPVHMINLPCNMDAIMAIAARRKLLVIEDACQAAGVAYKGRMCGAIGDIGAFSFNSFKNMNVGEGGALATSDPRLFARARNYHDLGAPIRGHQETFNEAPFVGANMRITELHGAILNRQLSKLNPMMARLRKRRRIVAEVLTRKGMRLAPHNDEPSAASLVVQFGSAEEAIAFAENPGVTRLLDSSKHVYTNWEAILSKRTAHPRMNPWAWAHREITYEPDALPRTLDILGRSCRITLAQRFPSFISRLMAHHLTRERPRSAP